MGNPKIQKEILDSIDIIVRKRMENVPQILFGIVTEISTGNRCDIAINAIKHQVKYYGETPPLLNRKYPVFVPASGMSQAFIIISGDTGDDVGDTMNIDGVTLIKTSDGIVKVNTADDVEQDNTLPVTSAAVYTNVGNIEALLETI